MEPGHFCRSAEKGGQCDVPSPSVNGPKGKSSVQFTADSVTGLQGRRTVPVSCLKGARDVEFLLFQEEGNSLPVIAGSKRSSDAEGVLSDGDMRYHLSLFPSCRSYSVPWCVPTWGCPLLKSEA